MSDPGYSILSACYANAEHTAVVAQTLEAGSVAASAQDRPELWARIHRSCTLIEAYELPAPAAAIQREGPQPAAAAALPPEAAPAPSSPSLGAYRQYMPPVGAEWSDSERREAAKERVRKAVVAVNHVTDQQQLNYELALMALNKKLEAMESLKEAASLQNITVEELARRTVAERDARLQRAGVLQAIEAQAMKDIDAASGAAIEQLVDQALASIEAAASGIDQR